MSVPIPEPILKSLKEFTAQGKTGQFALNIFEGQVLTADVREHISAGSKKNLDIVKKSGYLDAQTE